MGTRWTKEQQNVIESNQGSLLVSAAAGSGKTAVIVERMIRLLSDEQHPVDPERILMVTFTNAAAAEMKERIGKGMDNLIAQSKEPSFLQRQKLFLNCAQISTIHSLCLKLIKEYFDQLEIDPSFRMADETELQLIKSDTADNMMEKFYAESTAFKNFIDCYGESYSDNKIKEMIISIYNYSRAYPRPDIWLERCCQIYQDDTNHLASDKMVQLCIQQKENVVAICEDLLKQLRRVCMMDAGPLSYLKAVEDDQIFIEELKDAKYFNSIYYLLANHKWKALSRTSKCDEVLQKRAKDLRDQIKKHIDQLRTTYFSTDIATIKEEFKYLFPYVQQIVELVQCFSQEYEAAKRDKNILDYSDLEHYALKLLFEVDSSSEYDLGLKPSPIADLLAKKYETIICDEYQDSNLVQELILQVLSRERFGQYNRVMVGDVKQSIYRFRLADVRIFMDKYHQYSKDLHSMQRRIDLDKNFRSRDCVLNAVNFIFEQIMTIESCGILYDDSAALHVGNPYPEITFENISHNSEIIIVENNKNVVSDEEQEDKIELEAQALVKRIYELTDPEYGLDIFDQVLEKYRKLKYSDIVILLRSVTGTAEKIVELFNKNMIPCMAELSQGFFETFEVQIVLELLTIINNPHQDIPWAAVLKSPIAKLSSEELALIRSYDKKSDLYTATVMYENSHQASDKILSFMKLYQHLRTVSNYMEIDELLQYLYRKTGFYDYVQVLPDGKRRKANLDMLVERAVAFSNTSYTGLFNFVRYIEQLKENQIDFGEAMVHSADSNYVRIMTIHKSKGLEFPVVFLAGAGKGFNMQDTRDRWIVHQDYGIGLNMINQESHRSLKSFYKTMMGIVAKREMLAEEMRILYVAMTRAKEKLIISGVVNDIEKAKERWELAGSAFGKQLDYFWIEAAKNYLDWIMACVMHRHTNLFQITYLNHTSLMMNSFEVMTEQLSKKQSFLDEMSAGDYSEQNLYQTYEMDYQWKYEYSDLIGVKGKYSVSEVKKQAYEDALAEDIIENELFDEVYRPGFMKDETEIKVALTGADRGTAYHRLMEYMPFHEIDFPIKMEWLNNLMNKLVLDGSMTVEQVQSIYKKDILLFLNSKLGQRMITAARHAKLKCEAQFVTGVPLSMVRSEYNRDELVVIQGIIDAYFEEDNEIVLLDYKTDYVTGDLAEDELWKRYSKQMELYAYALENMTGKKVKERIIYSFSLKKELLMR